MTHNFLHYSFRRQSGTNVFNVIQLQNRIHRTRFATYVSIIKLLYSNCRIITNKKLLLEMSRYKPIFSCRAQIMAACLRYIGKNYVMEIRKNERETTSGKSQAPSERRSQQRPNHQVIKWHGVAQRRTYSLVSRDNFLIAELA